MQKILKQVGISVSKKGEIKIFGRPIEASSKQIKVKNLGDHRICMSTYFSCINRSKNYHKNFETVNTSAPSFLKIMN